VKCLSEGIKEIAEVIISRTNQIIMEGEKRICMEGGQFNLFSILNAERKEVSTHSAFIFELINPEGSHCQKDAYLKLFVEKVLGIYDFDYLTASIYREKFAGIYGRIDLLIVCSNYKIVLEVKIDAADQDRQIQRYHEYLKKTKTKTQKHKIYYLTLNGSEPSLESYGELNDTEKENIELISFENKVYIWLIECMNSKKINRVNSAINQYADMIRKITNSFDKEINKEVKDIILESVENYKAALCITSAVKEVRQSILNNFISKLKNKLKESSLIKELVEEEKIENYYNLPKNRNAYLTYLLKETNYDNINIYLCIEIDWRLYFSLWVAKSDKDGGINWDLNITKDKYNHILKEYTTDLYKSFTESKVESCLGWKYLYNKGQNTFNFYEEESEYNVEYLVNEELLDAEIENIFVELNDGIGTILK